MSDMEEAALPQTTMLRPRCKNARYFASAAERQVAMMGDG